MPLPLSYPGVYLEEIESSVRTIVGVSTSITAFVGVAADGPPNEATRLFSVAEYEKTFGAVNQNNELSQAVQLFFVNGGTDAYVVNVRSGGTTAAGTIKNDTSNGNAIDVDALTLTSKTAGKSRNQLRVRIDYDTSDPTNLFNITVLRETIGAGGDRSLSVLEGTHRNLSMNPDADRFVGTFLKRASRYLDATVLVPATAALAAAKGTSVSGEIPPTALDAVEDTVAAPGQGASLLAVGIDGGGPTDIDILDAGAPFITTDGNGRRTLAGSNVAARFASLAGAIQARLSATSPGTTCTATAAAPWKLTITSGAPGVSSSVRVVASANPGRAATKTLLLGAGNGGTERDAATLIRPASNTPEAAPTKYYYIGTTPGSAAKDTRQGGVVLGTDGPAPTSDAAGIRTWQSALNALLPVDLFNLLVIPGMASLPNDTVKILTGSIYDLCQTKRAFYIADLPAPPDPTNIDGVKSHFQQFTSTIGDRGAMFYPRVAVDKPEATGGAIAGIFARTDANRGVWKAPAGTDAVLRGIAGLETVLDDQKNGVLNIKGINVLRAFPTYGNVVWGARTAKGDDAQASQWKYTPVRRTALFIEESLYRGTQWVVFEPNDEPLWAQIRLNVGSFMQNLFRQNAFQGKSAAEAYFVKCDKDTTTQDDINRGIVNILVGFAPLKPAEFVVIQLQQMAGQIGV